MEPEVASPSGGTAGTPGGTVGTPPRAAGTPTRSEHDPARRAFFFEFGKQAVTAVGQVAGMADLVGRTTGGVASLLGLDPEPPPPSAPVFARPGRAAVVSAAPPAADGAFRSAYRLDGDDLVLLDQRGIPGALEEVVAKRGSDVAYYLRLGVARGGLLMAQLAAYGLALTARERAMQPREQRDVELERTMRALVDARPSARSLVWSMERMRAVVADFDRDDDGVAATDGGVATASVVATEGDASSEGDPASADHGDGDRLATALRAEADAIATDAGAWNAAIAAVLCEQLAALHDGPLVLLLHGNHGGLAGGVVGGGLPALQRLRAEGRSMRVYVTEGRPFMDGARLASWELRQAGIEHKVIADSAVAWLLQREPVDAVLIGAEWIAANGDTGALVGSRAIAQLAAASGTRLMVTGVSALQDSSTPDGAAIPEELRPARDLVAYLADVPIRSSDALVPAADVIPAAAISTLVTERGASTPGRLA